MEVESPVLRLFNTHLGPLLGGLIVLEEGVLPRLGLLGLAVQAEALHLQHLRHRLHVLHVQELLQQDLRLFRLPVQDLLLLPRTHQVSAEQTRSRAWRKNKEAHKKPVFTTT